MNTLKPSEFYSLKGRIAWYMSEFCTLKGVNCIVYELYLNRAFLKKLFKKYLDACFGSTYTKIGTIQRRLWPLHKDDTQIHEVFHIFTLQSFNKGVLTS